MTAPIHALLVEDNPADAMLTKETFEEQRSDLVVTVVEDGAAALAYLDRQAPYEAAPRPDLIVLDLNLPKVTGLQVLARVKQSATLQTIPVVVLSTSAADEDVSDSYTLGAASYVTKPYGLKALRTCLGLIGEYWFSLAAYASR